MFKIFTIALRNILIVFACFGTLSIGLLPAVSHADNYDTARNLQRQMNEAKSYQDMRMQGYDPNEPTPGWVKVFWGVVIVVVLGIIVIFVSAKVMDSSDARKKKKEDRLNSLENKLKPFTENEKKALLKHIDKFGTSYDSISNFAKNNYKIYDLVVEQVIQAGRRDHNPLIKPSTGDVVQGEGGVQREVLEILHDGDTAHVLYRSGSVERKSSFESWEKWCKKTNATVIKKIGAPS